MLSSRNGLFVALTLIFIASYLARNFFPEQFFRDQVKFFEADYSYGNEILSFLATNLFYNTITFNNPQILSLSAGIIYCYAISRDKLSFLNVLPIFYLFLPNILLNLVVLGKDTLPLLFTSLISILIMKRLKIRTIVIVCAITYCSYGYFIRSYYLAIFAVFIGLMLLKRSSNKIAAIALFSAMMLYISIYHSQYFALGAAHRDSANNYAAVLGDFDVRSMVSNIYIPTNLLEFLINQLYVSTQLSFPVVFFGAIKDAYITIANLIIYFIVYSQIRAKNNQWANVSGSLLFSHILVLPIFEPDVGSYARHLLSVSALLGAHFFFVGDKLAFLFRARSRSHPSAVTVSSKTRSSLDGPPNSD